MKKQIRRGVFETNSSSVHSLTMCNRTDFDKWENGEVLYWRDEEIFGTREELIEQLKKITWYDGSLRYPDVDWNDEDTVNDVFTDERIQTMQEYFEDSDFETFRDTYTTPGGEKVVAFGYYGHD